MGLGREVGGFFRGKPQEGDKPGMAALFCCVFIRVFKKVAMAAV